ncbi:MAG: META domain-containing protein [Culturomica sp.]|jgi:heat shock protein HslJ|nr:META domain-containing protein [Culturomica sp.]
MKKILLFITALVALAACESKKETVKIEDFKWVAVEMDGETLDEAKSEDIFIQFSKADRKISGKASCNRYFGSYELAGDKLTFSQTGATKMACLDMKLEDTFFDILKNTDNYKMKDGKLSFRHGKTVLAVFKKTEKE